MTTVLILNVVQGAGGVPRRPISCTACYTERNGENINACCYRAPRKTPGGRGSQPGEQVSGPRFEPDTSRIQSTAFQYGNKVDKRSKMFNF